MEYYKRKKEKIPFEEIMEEFIEEIIDRPYVSACHVKCACMCVCVCVLLTDDYGGW